MLRYNSMSTANLANGNTSTVSSLDIRDQNPPLDCIQVSSVAYANNLLTVGWWQKDANIQVSTDCSTMVTEDFRSKEFAIYPNPAKDFLAIENLANETISSVEIYT